MLTKRSTVFLEKKELSALVGLVIEDIVAVNNASGGEFLPDACCAQPTSTRRRSFAAACRMSPKKSASRGSKPAKIQHHAAEAGHGAAGAVRR